MEASRFDAWTRRRFGLAVKGLTAVSFALLTTDLGTAKKKKACKKSRCRTLAQTCEPNSKEQSCCQGLNCDPVAGQGFALFCCLGRQQRCQADADCCGATRCFDVAGLDGLRCCSTGQELCASDADCCSGYECVNFECAAISDRAQKANFASVDHTDMLARVRELPIATWNYLRDDPTVRHIGPMAQDFANTFGVGADNRHIYPIDGQGVALAAIQGLIAEVEQLRAANDGLAQRLDDLETVTRHAPPTPLSSEVH